MVSAFAAGMTGLLRRAVRTGGAKQVGPIVSVGRGARGPRLAQTRVRCPVGRSGPHPKPDFDGLLGASWICA
jgi:hypothetical protein